MRMLEVEIPYLDPTPSKIRLFRNLKVDKRIVSMIRGFECVLENMRWLFSDDLANLIDGFRAHHRPGDICLFRHTCDIAT